MTGTNLGVAYPVLGVYILLLVVIGIIGAYLNWRGYQTHKDKVGLGFWTREQLCPRPLAPSGAPGWHGR